MKKYYLIIIVSVLLITGTAYALPNNSTYTENVIPYFHNTYGIGLNGNRYLYSFITNSTSTTNYVSNVLSVGSTSPTVALNVQGKGAFSDKLSVSASQYFACLGGCSGGTLAGGIVEGVSFTGGLGAHFRSTEVLPTPSMDCWIASGDVSPDGYGMKCVNGSITAVLIDTYTAGANGRPANLFYVIGPGMAGIGTSSPFGRLSVEGDAGGTTTLLVKPFNVQTAPIVDIMAPGGASSIFQIASSSRIDITTSATLNTGLNMYGNVNDFYQLNIQNKNAGVNASGDLSITADNGDENTHYINLGTNNSNGAKAPFTTANETYLYSVSDTLNIGALGANNAIKFFTTGGINTPAQRLVIASNGNVGLGTTTPYNILSVVGTTTAAVFEATSTATSTARNGWNIQGGCYAIASVCVTGGGGSGSGTVNSGLLSQVAYYAANGTTVSGSSTLVVAQTTDFSMGVLNQGRVGVGTSTPGSMLSLGASDTGWNFTPGTSTINTTGGLNVVKGCFSQNGSCLSGSVGIGTTGWFPYYAANGDKVTATSTIFVDSMSEVGLGTTTPAWALNVAGTRPSIGLTDNLAGTNDKHWVISNMGGNLYFSTSTDVFATSTPAAFSVNRNKPAGISVSSSTPSAQLTINTSNSGYANAAYVGSSSAAASFRIDNSGNIFAPNTLGSGANQTGYWCYDANGQFIRDTTTCLISASKFKKNITPINSGLDEVLAMKPVNYYLKNPLGNNDAVQQFGFIAEDAEKVDPRLVTYDNKGDIHGFRYEQYTAVLTKAIQELNTKVEQGTNVVQEYWQWILISILFGGLAYQQIQIRRLQK